MHKKINLTIDDVDFNKLTPELIEWEDIHTISNAWVEYDEIDHSCPVVKTLGFVVKEDDKYITIVQTIAEDYQLLNGLVIPKSVIKNRKKLK